MLRSKKRKKKKEKAVIYQLRNSSLTSLADVNDWDMAGQAEDLGERFCCHERKLKGVENKKSVSICKQPFLTQKKK